MSIGIEELVTLEELKASSWYQKCENVFRSISPESQSRIIVSEGKVYKLIEHVEDMMNLTHLALTYRLGTKTLNPEIRNSQAGTNLNLGYQIFIVLKNHLDSQQENSNHSFEDMQSNLEV